LIAIDHGQHRRLQIDDQQGDRYGEDGICEKDQALKNAIPPGIDHQSDIGMRTPRSLATSIARS
jgi:hypothetical protein